MLAVGGAFLALPDFFRFVPRWLQLTIVVVLLAATVIARLRGRAGLHRALGHLLASVNTIFLLRSLVLLILALPDHKESAVPLFHSAFVL